MKGAVASGTLAFVVLVAWTVPAVWAGAEAGMGAGHSGKMKEKWDKIPEEKKAKGLAVAESKKLFGKLTYGSDGWAEGKFVRFHFAEAIGAIHDFAAKDGTNSFEFFDEVKPSAYDAKTDPFVTGSVLHAPDPDHVAILAHNNPTTIVQWRSHLDGLNLTVTLAPGAVAGAMGKNVRINVTGPNGTIHGHLMTNGATSISNATGNLTVTLNAGEKAMFRTHPNSAASSAGTLHDANDAFTGKKLGVVLNVADGDGAAIEDGSHVDVDAETTKLTKGNVTIKLNSDQTSARIVFLTVDGAVIDPANADKIVVKLNGNALGLAANSKAVVDGTTAMAHIQGFTAEGTVHIVVYVDHFSEQTLTVEQSTEGATKTTAGAGLAAVVAAVLFALAVAARRRT